MKMNCQPKNLSTAKQKKASEKSNASQLVLDIEQCKTLQDAADYMLNFRSFVRKHNHSFLTTLIESTVIEIFEKLHVLDSNYSMISISEIEENYSTLLSPRERECLNWCSLGKTNKEIARTLDIPDHIVNLYFTEIRKKFNATTNAQCVATAIRKGII